MQGVSKLFLNLYNVKFLYRSTWQMVRALQIFAETVYVKLSEIEGMHFLFRRILIVSRNC